MSPPTADGPRVLVGATNNDPELIDRIPITRPDQPRQWRVAMSLGPLTKTDTPLPDLRPGDKLIVYAELEVTTDYEQATHPGLIGKPYSYAPKLEARFLLAGDAKATERAAAKAVAIAPAVTSSVSHQRHHHVVRLHGAEYTVAAKGLPWQANPTSINVVISATSPAAKPGHVLLVGENEKTKTVDQDIAGIRVIRFRPAAQDLPAPQRLTKASVAGVPVAKRPTVVFSVPIKGLKRDEQLFVHGRLRTDAADTGYAIRISARLIVADSPTAVDPGKAAQTAASWKGNLSKENGFNCLLREGIQVSDKYGVMRVMRDFPRDAFINLTATSSAPFLANNAPGGLLPVKDGSFIEVTRYEAGRRG